MYSICSLLELQFLMYVSVTLSSWFSCFHLPSMEIIGSLLCNSSGLNLLFCFFFIYIFLLILNLLAYIFNIILKNLSVSSLRLYILIKCVLTLCLALFCFLILISLAVLELSMQIIAYRPGTDIHPSASASQMLGLKACTTIPESLCLTLRPIDLLIQIIFIFISYSTVLRFNCLASMYFLVLISFYFLSTYWPSLFARQFQQSIFTDLL